MTTRLSDPPIVAPSDLMHHLPAHLRWPKGNGAALLYHDRWLGQQLRKSALGGQPEIGIVRTSMGAPAATFLMELLIAAGARRFVFIGTAGALQVNLRAGDLVVCEAALANDGTSGHYQPPGQEVGCALRLCERVEEQLQRQGWDYQKGRTWTTDAVFREAASAVRSHAEAGRLCVEMEAAALYAVAVHRGVEAVTLAVISDSLAQLKWQNFRAEPLGEAAVRTGLSRAAEAALQSLSAALISR